jgi:hypothetical protein
VNADALVEKDLSNITVASRNDDVPISIVLGYESSGRDNVAKTPQIRSEYSFRRIEEISLESRPQSLAIACWYRRRT